ncbi:uncharacterized protein [Diadema setosum]|uniref:uncharacterized protein n=1 Tax=Diadema setosum TaxID=31175 RepID=UPI003B3ACF2E
MEPTGGFSPLMAGRAASWKAATVGAVTAMVGNWFQMRVGRALEDDDRVLLISPMGFASLALYELTVCIPSEVLTYGDSEVKKRPRWQLQIYHLKVWRDGTFLYLYLYKRNEEGSRAEKKYRIRNYTTRFGLPEYAHRLMRERGRIVTIQTSDPSFDVLYIVFEKEKLKEFTRSIDPYVENPYHSRPVTQQFTDIPYEVYPDDDMYEPPPSPATQSTHQPRHHGPGAPPLPRRSNSEYPLEGVIADTSAKAMATSREVNHVPGPSYLLKSRSTSDVSCVNNLSPQWQITDISFEDEQDTKPTSNVVAKDRRRDETLTDYVMQFRRDQHREHGIVETVRAADISRQSLKLACHKKSLVVADVSTSLAKKLHVGDVLLRADDKALYTTHDCYDTFKCATKHEVDLQLQRVPEGVMCHVSLPEDGRIEALGAEFESDSFGIEVTKFNGSGLLVLKGQISNRLSARFSKDEEKINLGLVEINRNPVPLDSSNKEVKTRLRKAGQELALLFLPMDLVQALRIAADSEK